ncbi:unnamed protein product [Ascophyllum nodosum]
MAARIWRGNNSHGNVLTCAQAISDYQPGPDVLVAKRIILQSEGHNAQVKSNLNASVSGQGQDQADPPSGSSRTDPREGKNRLEPLRQRKSNTSDGQLQNISLSERGSNRRASARLTRGGNERTVQVQMPYSRPSNMRTGQSERPVGPPNRGEPSARARTDNGQLKAQIRVMEWKRREGGGLRAQRADQETCDQKPQVEAFLEAARKLAATRAKETGRRVDADRENTPNMARSSKKMGRRAKIQALRERERRRAEIYAINAVMRDAFEKEFNEYSLEKERQANEARNSSLALTIRKKCKT